jgi:hypothetical protein
LVSAKLNPVRVNGESNNSAGLAFAPGAVTPCDEGTEGQWLFTGMGVRRQGPEEEWVAIMVVATVVPGREFR